MECTSTRRRARPTGPASPPPTPPAPPPPPHLPPPPSMRGQASLLLLVLAACRAAPIPPESRYPAGTALTAKYETLDGSRIRYIEAGTGPAVLFFHGFGASLYAWRNTLPPVAAAGFRAIAFDNRGFGFADKPAHGYGNADYTRLVVAFL